MLRRCVAILVLSCLCATSAAQADPTDDFIKERLAGFQLPGLSLAVVKDGEIVKAEGYGFAEIDGRVPATPETVYKIGSISKQFIATGIMILAQEKRLRLDDRINKYLQSTPSSWAPITIRQLLTHTSGIVRESPAFSPMRNRSNDELLAAAHKVPLRFAPGDKWEYSNMGYVALAEIIRSVSGQPWSEYLHEKVFAPAGMTVTRPTNTTASVPNRAVGYTGTDNKRKADEWVALRTSGAFLSNVLDLAKWDALLYRDDILSQASRREMWTGVRLNDASSYPYGLGWHADPGVGKRRRIWHGGGLPGFTAHFVRYVDEKLSVIALSNGDDSDMGAIANGVAAMYLR